ncbi:transposase [Komagataeibacter rhaeticus DSM 16663]|nr:transposase [Komagataeibacter rhaeticus DSM 16663]
MKKPKDRDQALGMIFFNGATIHPHHKPAGAVKKGDTGDTTGIVRNLALAPKGLRNCGWAW